MEKSLLKVAERADAFFMSRSPIHDTMQRLAKCLDELNISYAVAGAMAANMHGHRRTTEDVDILLRREDLKRFKDRWSGLGWMDVFSGSKAFRDTRNNVKVDVLIVGDYPGDGKEKPVAFPAPECVLVRDDLGIPFLNLKTLLELKIASGMSAEHRPRDLDDAIQLIRINQLSLEFSEELNEYVRDRYRSLWHSAQIKEDY